MKDDKRCYCQLLGINPFNEQRYTEESIKDKIDKAEVKWNNEYRNKQNDPGRCFQIHKLADQVPEMRRVMSDPILRKAQFAEARKSLEGLCQGIKLECLTLRNGRSIVLPGNLEPFRKRLNWEGVDTKTILDITGVSDGSNGGMKRPVGDRVHNAFTNLQTVDTYTPSEMLNALIGNPDLEIRCDPLSDSSSPSQLRNAFDLCEKRIGNVRQDVLPDLDTYISVIRSLKLVMDDDREIQSLVNYGKCNKALEPVKECLLRDYASSPINRKTIDELLTIHTRGMNPDLCLSILENFCYIKRLKANFSNVDSILARCPGCDCLVEAANITFCPYCGKNFRTVCPQCGTTQQSGNVNCIKCGFNFKEGEMKAQSIILSFRMDIQKGLINKAEKDLMALKETCSSSNNISSMENRLQSAKNALAALRKMLLEAYSLDKFYTAKCIGDDINERFPDSMSSDPMLKQRHQDAQMRVENADVKLAKIKNLTDKNEIMEAYVDVASICPDLPEARSYLKEHPPRCPIDPKVKILDNHVVIRYEAPSDSKDVTYVVYRDKNSLPSITEETRPLVETPSCEYVDKTMEPGVEYYYSVHSKRWGVLSKDAIHIGPVMILNEVDKVSIEQIEGGLRIMYDKPRGATRVRLWRASDSDSGSMGIEIPLNGETVYDDVGLKGGVKYHYLFVAEYETRNKVERSQGAMYSATTVDMPAPVRDMTISWNKSDGTYTAKWSTKEHVTLYRSDKKYAMAGTIVKVKDIESWMTEIKTDQDYDEGVRFSLPDGTVQYVYPIIKLGNIAVRGNERMVANLKPFRDVEKIISNKDCIITMNWPEGAVAAKLVVSNNGVKDINDATAEIVTVRREQYAEDKMVRIPMGRAKKKSINIYAVYKIGNESITSRGMVIEAYSTDCKKIRYSLKCDRRGANIEFETDPSVTEIPTVIAIHVEEGIPLYRNDGEVVGRIDRVPLRDGRAKTSMSVGGYTDQEHIRLFFENEEVYNELRFVHPLYNRRD